MKFFRKSLMSSEFDGAKLQTGKFYDGATPASIHDGAVVSIGGLLDSTAYTGLKDKNVRKITVPTTATDNFIGIVDYAGVSNGDILGNNYKVGFRTLGLTAPAKEPVAVRVCDKFDTFVIGEDNISNTITTATKYIVPTASSTLFTAVSAIPANGFVAEITEAVNETQGTEAVKGYFCTTIRG